jgi:hypothetical protein
MISERIDNITRIAPQYLGTVIPAPKSCKIEITADCNYKCGFCVKSLRADNGQMDRKLYSRLIRELFDAGVVELGVFYIGESFTCPWLPDAIREAKEVGFPYVFLTTNGAAAPPQKLKACFEAGLDSLKFSINFSDKEQLASVARVGPSHWQKAIDNLKHARTIRDAGQYPCGIYASSIAFDGEQGEAMRKVVDEIRPFVDEHYWLPLFNMNGASKAAGMSPGPGNPGRLGAMREPLPCWAVFTEAHINKDGGLVACCFGDLPDNGLLMADLTKSTFMEGWNSLAFRELRGAHLNKNVSGTACEKCVAAG